MLKFTFWERLQMGAARPLLWSLQGGKLRLFLCTVLSWEVFFLAPTALLPWWADMVLVAVAVLLMWKHDPKKSAAWLVVQSGRLWLEQHRSLLASLIHGGMDWEEAYILLKMHEHGERRDGVLDEAEWQREEQALVQLLFGPEFEVDDDDTMEEAHGGS